jgi:hypothetical protein
MIQKINDSAYFLVDIDSFSSTLQVYDSVLANQSITPGPESEPNYNIEQEQEEKEQDRFFV